MRARMVTSSFAVTIAVAAIVTAAPPASSRAGDPEVTRLRREVEGLRSEQDLAAGKGFYLRLDAGRQSLTLMLQGVSLDEYAARGVAWGLPEVAFVERKPAADWDAAPFSKGRLEPQRERDRLEVTAPPPATGASDNPGRVEPLPPPPPKSAEESISVPSQYRIVFAEGVSLEVRAKGAGGRNRSVFRRVADAVSLRLSDLGTAIGLGSRERVRLRVTLDAEDAAALYRSLPPDAGLVVVGLPVR
jgi:hypothetical protein